MKFLYKRYLSQPAKLTCFLLAGLLLQSCSKDERGKPLNAGQANIMISVLGVSEDAGEGKVKLKASSAIREAVKQPENIPGKLLNFKSFDALVSIEQGSNPGSRVSVGSTGDQHTTASGLLAEVVEAGVKYRLLIYTQSGEFVDSQLLTSGEVEEIKVPKGDDYFWYAVSYNNTDDIPDVDTANPQLTLPGDKDVLYASGSLSIPESAPDDNIPLGIVFKHSFARVTIELNTMGMFADMISAEVNVTGNAAMTGTLDLKTGNISGLTNSTQTLDFSSFVNAEEPYADRKIAHFYTADESQINDLTVTITGLELEIDDGSTRTFTGINSVFTFDLTPQRGASYDIKVNLVESPLTIAGVSWARQNLYYQGGHNPYRFHHTYAHSNARNTYFSFRGMVPTNFGSDSNDGDPCALVYPQGVWRQASDDDFRSLTGGILGGGETATYGTQGGLGYLEYQASTGPSAPYPSNNLRFNMNGGGVSVGLVDGIIELDLGASYGSSAQLWSHDPALDVLGLAWAGAYAYNGTSSDQTTVIDAVQVGLLGIGVVESSFKNVRCVRN